MVVKNFGGYTESFDITKIPEGRLAYPSKNVFVYKGKVTTRGGLLNDGNASTGIERIHSEKVWKDALGGVRPIRCTGQKVQVKYEGKWYTIYESLTADALRVVFATWVDGNGSIFKKRLFFVDGSTGIYQWNGALEKVESIATDTITLDISTTGERKGFDNGSVTNQPVRIIRRDVDGNVLGTEDYLYDNNPTADTLHLTTTPSNVPVAGDLVIAGVTKESDAISATFNIDAIYSYQNHIVVASFDSVSLYFSHIETYSLATGLDFTIPVPASRTALTPILMQLDSNFTAMEARKNVLWVSDPDDWYKMTKTVEQNAYDLWVDVEKFETGERKGALPLATAKYKGDIIYLAQDQTLQQIESVEILGRDDIRQLSDEVELLFQRLDFSDVRLYYLERAIYIIAPAENTLIMLDLVENYFQPPQVMPISCISVIDGVKYGHHNSVDETFALFSGTQDLGTEINATIAFGYDSGQHTFKFKQTLTFGASIRLSGDTKVTITQEFEEDGAKASPTFNFTGSDSTLKSYAVTDDVSWATHPYGDRSWAGADMTSVDLKRGFIFDKPRAISWFNYRPIFTISGANVEFHLLAWFIEDAVANRKVGNEHFNRK